jgi:hypothetical protein
MGLCTSKAPATHDAKTHDAPPPVYEAPPDLQAEPPVAPLDLQDLMLAEQVLQRQILWESRYTFQSLYPQTRTVGVIGTRAEVAAWNVLRKKYTDPPPAALFAATVQQMVLGIPLQSV